MIQQTFLVEIGTEELPPKSLRFLAESFATNFTVALDSVNLTHGKVFWYATPRRLALKVTKLDKLQPIRKIEKRGPSIDQSFNFEGKPTKAAQFWAHSCGTNLDHVERFKSNKGEWLIFRSIQKRYSAQQLIPTLVSNVLSKLPFQKMMRWGSNNSQFIRPVNTVTMLLGSELIPLTIFGIQSDRIIWGHRFMGEERFIINHADQYPQILMERGKVIADYEMRKAIIKRDSEKEAQKIGGIVHITEELLEEVTALVEWPVVLTATFEEKFLSVPNEVLVYTMKYDQKYFPIYNARGRLLSYFIFISNIASKDPKCIIHGNEKVLRSRFVDAEFFFNTDRKKRLEEYLPNLKNVLFQQALGTLYDKTNRLEALSSWIAGQIGANVKLAARAGFLSKCDLVTNMVFEFPGVQGVIGMHYARADGEEEEVAVALKEQYWPKFSGDFLPENLIANSLAIADKIDTITGMFGIRHYPKGDKDPFALRRAALGLMRIIIKGNFPLDLVALTKESVYLYGHKITNKNVIDDVINFMLNRLRAWYQEQGYTSDTIQAISVLSPTKPIEFDARIKAVSYFRSLPDSKALTTANKRVSKILAKSTEILGDHIETCLLKKTAEIKLAMNLIIMRNRLDPLFAQGKYQEALCELAALREPIDLFFKQVMVMDNNERVRINRLTLLKKIHDLFLEIADISILQ
ncbi:glycine--tRNA ligase subunit beta [Candidatus Profftia sp. (ex Adelges kitamiensis)]|uniref:glycine--tRNA ligase subunit beta n=1 Tax=Candidatus Profftia sp. (ex Adelges kitamiensis) TaxID=2864218 RepID=UPI001CE36703|nr:glycine--tRNA ligase subunit beta [Candidatus Profftia sp. (ex Adelges kitamiensis)]